MPSAPSLIWDGDKNRETTLGMVDGLKEGKGWVSVFSNLYQQTSLGQGPAWTCSCSGHLLTNYLLTYEEALIWSPW